MEASYSWVPHIWIQLEIVKKNQVCVEHIQIYFLVIIASRIQNRGHLHIVSISLGVIRSVEMIKIHGKKYRFHANNILFYYIQDLSSCALVPMVSYIYSPTDTKGHSCVFKSFIHTKASHHTIVHFLSEYLICYLEISHNAAQSHSLPSPSRCL